MKVWIKHIVLPSVTGKNGKRTVIFHHNWIKNTGYLFVKRRKCYIFAPLKNAQVVKLVYTLL